MGSRHGPVGERTDQIEPHSNHAASECLNGSFKPASRARRERLDDPPARKPAARLVLDPPTVQRATFSGCIFVAPLRPPIAMTMVPGSVKNQNSKAGLPTRPRTTSPAARIPNKPARTRNHLLWNQRPPLTNKGIPIQPTKFAIRAASSKAFGTGQTPEWHSRLNQRPRDPVGPTRPTNIHPKAKRSMYTRKCSS